MGKDRNIWLILDHPNQLATALGLASYFDRKKYNLNLLISYHQYWDKVPPEIYQKLFDKWVIFERPDYTLHPFKIIKNFLLISRTKKQVSGLKFDKNDIIIGLSIFHYLENITLSVYQSNVKIAVMPKAVFSESIDPLDEKMYYETLEGRIFNKVIEPFFSLYRTWCKKYRNNPNIYCRIRYRKPLYEIYDFIIILESVGESKQIDRKTYSMPFPYLLHINPASKESVKRKKVVFFGDIFKNGIYGVSADVYAEYVNRCLEFLRNIYSKNYSLVYRPHPRETDEIICLNLDNFEVQRDGILTELYLFQHYQEIHAIFSVASTSSRTGFFFNIPSFVFFKFFPFNETVNDYLVNEAGDVPAAFFIDTVETMPPTYVNDIDFNNNIRLCKSVLDEVFTTFIQS